MTASDARPRRRGANWFFCCHASMTQQSSRGFGVAIVAEHLNQGDFALD